MDVDLFGDERQEIDWPELFAKASLATLRDLLSALNRNELIEVILRNGFPAFSGKNSELISYVISEVSKRRK